MLERIASSRYAELVLVARHDNTVPERQGMSRQLGFGSRLAGAIRRMARGVQAILEDKVGGCIPDAFEASKGLDQFRDIQHLDLISAPERWGAQIDPFDAERIRAFDIDVFIGLGIAPCEGDIPNVATYGIWSLPRANSRIDGNGATADGFWEVFHDNPVTESMLQISRADSHDAKVTDRTFSATCTASVRLNRNTLHWKGSLQIPRKLEQLRLLGPDAFFENIKRLDEIHSIPANPALTMPRLFDEIVLVSRIFWRIYSSRIRNFFVSSQWILLFDFRDEFELSSSAQRKIVPPRDRIWADPHVLIRDRRYYAFIEELPHSRNKGHISVMEMREDGKHTAPRRVLEEPYHLSNPFVFEHEEQLFLIPESARNCSVDLYRCVSFPDKWERCETLLKDVHAVDTTVHFHRGKWWLFTNIRDHVSGSSDDDLFLFYSDVLQRGRWMAHPCNPIVSDVTRARPAGNIFEHEGRLYRPAQDCSIRYGYGIRIQEILEMSESKYLERQVAFIEPKRKEKIIATHTLSRAGRLILGDALEERWELFPGSRRSA
jgi:hypothetical protein